MTGLTKVLPFDPAKFFNVGAAVTRGSRVTRVETVVKPARTPSPPTKLKAVPIVRTSLVTSPVTSDLELGRFAVAVKHMYEKFHVPLTESLQNIHTPFKLCFEILSKLEIDPSKTFLVVSAVEFVAILIDVFKVPIDNIAFYDEGVKSATISTSVKSALMEHVFHMPKTNLLNEDTVNMKKFDFVVGNPPYLKRGWRDFFELMIARSDSIVACICPDPSSNSTNFGGQFRNMLKTAGVQSITECTDAFSNVASGKISYFICDKNKMANLEVFASSSNMQLALKNKILSVRHVSGIPFFSRGSQASISCNKQKHRIGEHQTQCIFSVQNDTLEIVYVAGSAFPKRTKNKEQFNGKFLAINRFFGKNKHDPIYEIDEISDKVIGYNVIVFKLGQGETIESFRSLYCSKLYKFVMHTLRNGAFDITQSNLSLLPRLDLTKVWTDAELYQFFNLTEEEIEYIESFDMP